MSTHSHRTFTGWYHGAKIISIWAILQYPGHLHREILIFSQKSLRTIYTYHLVPFKLPKNVQKGPFQGLLVFRYFFQKISNFTKYALTPLFFGWPSSVIPFRKALAFPVVGSYWSLTWWSPPMRNKHIKIGIFNTVTSVFNLYENFSFLKSSFWKVSRRPMKKNW